MCFAGSGEFALTAWQSTRVSPTRSDVAHPQSLELVRTIDGGSHSVNPQPIALAARSAVVGVLVLFGQKGACGWFLLDWSTTCKRYKKKSFRVTVENGVSCRHAEFRCLGRKWAVPFPFLFSALFFQALSPLHSEQHYFRYSGALRGGFLCDPGSFFGGKLSPSS